MPYATDGTLTICSSPLQPALMWTDRVDLGPGKRAMFVHSTMQPFDFVHCERCRQKRWAAYCDRLGGGWYDPQFYCAPGHGCLSLSRRRYQP